MNRSNHILAIDTSCDDTAAAVVSRAEVWSNVIASQAQLHKKYGGVFPTVAKLAHRENIIPTVALALERAGVEWPDIDAVAVTQGPGLAPALEVGLAAAKELAVTHKKPLLPINHIEGHLLSVLAVPKGKSLSDFQLPAVAVIVSGGHTQFVLVEKIGHYEILGSKLDDAAGECLDKIGRMLNLGYPAGATIEKFAKLGDPQAYEFPLPLTHVHNFDLSFSGLKTFARNLITNLTAEQPLTQQQVYDLCASAQYGVFRHITYKLNKLLKDLSVKEIWHGGGVAANMTLRNMLRQTAREHGIAGIRVPYTKKLCADNAAMIGLVAGLQEIKAVDDVDKLERVPRLRLETT